MIGFPSMLKQDTTKLIGAAIVGALVTAIVAGIVTRFFGRADDVQSLKEWKAATEVALQERDSMRKDLTSALSLLDTNNKSVQILQQQLETLRAVQEAGRKEIVSKLDLTTQNIFSLNDWKREKELLALRFTVLQQALEDLHDKVVEQDVRLEKKLDQHVQDANAHHNSKPSGG